MENLSLYETQRLQELRYDAEVALDMARIAQIDAVLEQRGADRV